MKPRKEIMGQTTVKHKDLRFVKKNNNPIWKLFPGKERRKEQNPERKLLLRITCRESRNIYTTRGKFHET